MVVLIWRVMDFFSLKFYFILMINYFNYQSINQSINESTNQPNNQPINQSTKNLSNSINCGNLLTKLNKFIYCLWWILQNFIQNVAVVVPKSTLWWILSDRIDHQILFINYDWCDYFLWTTTWKLLLLLYWFLYWYCLSLCWLSIIIYEWCCLL